MSVCLKWRHTDHANAPPPYDIVACRPRNLVKRSRPALKDDRRVATRGGKLAANLVSGVLIAETAIERANKSGP